MKETAKDIDATDVTGDNRIVKISVVGVGMRSHAGVASTIFNRKKLYLKIALLQENDYVLLNLYMHL